MEFDELREAIARVVVNLALNESTQNLLVRQPIIPVLVLIVHQTDG